MPNSKRNGRRKEKGMRDKLIRLIMECSTYTPNYEEQARLHAEYLAQHLLNEGVIVPPVKVGQSLFILEDIGIRTLPEIVPLTVYNLAFTVFEEGIKSHIVCITKSRKVRHIKGEDLGETAFFALEEAEKALAERSGE